jgi:cysteine-rich repeat protein
MIRMRLAAYARIALASATLGALLAGCGGGDDTPPPPPGGQPPTINSFTANPAATAPGGTVTLTWSVSNATSVSIAAMPGGVVLERSTEPNGMVTSPSVTQATTFTLTATGEGGTKTQSVMVTVDENAVAIVRFDAMPNPAPLGEVTTLRWQTAGANRVRILQGADEIHNTTTDVASGTFEVEIDQPSVRFTLVASNDQRQQMLEIEVRGVEAPEVLEFRARPQLFTGASGSISLNWRTANATMITMTQNGMPVPGFTGAATGTITVTVSDATRFELVASNAAGEDRATQAVARATQEREPNDDPATATPIMGGAQGEITAGDTDYFSFTVPAGGNVYIETSDGQGGCAFDTVISVFNSGGDEIASNDDGGAAVTGGSGRCSKLEPADDLFDLPAGTYTVAVSGFQDRAGMYALLVLVSEGRCGNDIIERSRMENCDDGNMMTGDGCDATCKLEVRGTVSGPGMNMTFNGMLGAGQFVVYQIDMASTGFLRAEIFAPTMGSCTGDSVLILVNDMSQLVGIDDDDGIEACSKIDPARDDFAELAAGRYFLAIQGRDQAVALGNYVLVVETLRPGCGNGVPEANEQCDDGNMAAGDGCTAQCTFEVRGTIGGPPASQTLTGMLGVGQNAVYEINLSSPGYVRAEVFLPTLNMCMGSMMYNDTELVLTSSTGRRLGRDDDDGVGLCSQIEPGRDSFAALPAGRALLILRPLDPTKELGPYTLVVSTFGEGCGNGVMESGEQCDDRNTMAGDGCNATCQLEVARTFMPPGGNATFMLPSAGRIAAFQVNIAQNGQSITATVASPRAGDCGPDVDVRLLTSNGTVLGETATGFGGDCAVILFPGDAFATDLATGSYLIVVERTETSTATPGDYRIDVGVINARCGDGALQSRANEQCDDHNTMNGDGCSSQCRFEGNVRPETEPNNMQGNATATNAARGMTVTMAGSIMPAGDLDYFSFEVPQGQTASLTATTYGRLGDRMTCNGDTFLTLFDSMGIEIATSDDDGFNLCSEITGTAAANLMAGRYYLQVREYDETETIQQYFLDVQLQ